MPSEISWKSGSPVGDTNSQSGFYLSNGKRRIRVRKVSFIDRETFTAA
jgi:hypothetical protein